jgi:2-oxoglutarate dehydrogenase E2 component (dihydrolipoamide succinyltransferase)
MMAAIERAAAAPTPVAQPAAAVHVRAPSPATMPRAKNA